MPAQRHILAVSGSRADYSLLYWPMRLLAEDSSFRLSVAATGMHLSRTFGHTIDQFARDGFPLAAQVPVLGEDDNAAGMARAIGRGILGFVDVIEKLKPDMLLVLGDRFEILAAAEAAFVQRVPIAHLCGGDVTNGALDDGFRHAITKMASLHFVTNDAAARRVGQLGEMPERIFNVGSTGIDFIKQASYADRAALSAELGYEIPQQFLLVTFHPVTLDPMPSTAQMGELLAALCALPPEIGIIFTYANADAEGIALNDLIRGFVAKRPGAQAHTSLAPLTFQSLMKHAVAIVGNSSSGLYEAPSFDVPSVNIGRRQEGRPRAASVIDCAPARAAIGAAIDQAMILRPQGTVNPYGDGRASARIVAALRGIADWPSLVFKEFRDQPV